MALLRSLLFFVFQVVTLTVWGSLFLLVAPFLNDRRRYAFAMRWPWISTWGARTLLGLRWQLEGAEVLAQFDGKPAIVCSKHQSAWETLFLPSQLKTPLCFVFKKELLRIPFFGWGIGLLPMIHVDRSQGRQAYESIQAQAGDRLGRGFWIAFFPEGTRTRPGQKVRYKNGAARLATELQVPVIPIAHNAGVFWPRNAWIKRPGCITVKVGPAIYPNGRSADAVLEEIAHWIESESDGLVRAA